MKIVKLIKFPLVCLLILAPFIAWLVFGDQGLLRLYQARQERDAHREKIRLLNQENQLLLDEIDRLRHDMEYVENVVRRELNLVKDDEIIYRFEEK